MIKPQIYPLLLSKVWLVVEELALRTIGVYGPHVWC